MRRESKKHRARRIEADDARLSLLLEVGRCELCGHDPTRPQAGKISWRLDVHEIARGPCRQDALDKRFAVLVLCAGCHMLRIHGHEDWPEARQLAILKKSRPHDHDLAAYNELKGFGPDRITEEDVNQHARH